jgi:hypothetical protein
VRICRKPPNRWGKYTCTNIYLTWYQSKVSSSPHSRRSPRPPAAASGRRLRRLFLTAGELPGRIFPGRILPGRSVDLPRPPLPRPAVRLRVFLAYVSGRPPCPRSDPLDRIARSCPSRSDRPLLEPGALPVSPPVERALLDSIPTDASDAGPARPPRGSRPPTDLETRSRGPVPAPGPPSRRPELVRRPCSRSSLVARSAGNWLIGCRSI